MSYVSTIRVPPKTLTSSEQEMLLRKTGEHRDTFRDHMLFSVALGTALREHEIAALNMGDLFNGAKARRRVPLSVFKRTTAREAARQEIVLSRNLRAKLERLRAWKKREGEGVGESDPLFISRRRSRLSMRQMRRLFRQWQERCGFERLLGFHCLRHGSGTNHYMLHRDIRLTQIFMRHGDVRSTSIYTHPSDEMLMASVEDLPC